ncbi:SDR family oxidoreductase, partial [Deltaproteobacteria bacterium]|nr:SDR family oxidoreductase [Deltaproteobacteria bacterium]
MKTDLLQVLVTGATGFVGRALVPELLAKSCQIRASVRKPSALPVEVEQVVVDFDEIEGEGAITAMFSGVDVVVHAAARVHMMEDQSANPLVAFRKLNRDATLSLADLAVDSGVKRFVFLSSIKVNGEETFPRRRPCIFKPDDEFIPIDPYGLSKFEAEQGLLALAKETGMEVVIIRPPLVYGPGVKANFASMINWLRRGVPLPLGAINNNRSFVALDNLVSFIALCADRSQSPKAANQVFLISDGEDVSTTQLLRKVAGALGKEPWLLPVPVGLMSFAARLIGKGDVANRLFGSLQVDNSKARDLLG